MKHVTDRSGKAPERQFQALNRPKRLSDEIARQISERIATGVFAPGERMPTEAELAVEFAVGRSAIREAIAKLRQEGLVTTRQGVGAFVTEDPGAASFQIDTDGLRTIEDFRHVMELRMELEVSVAAMAARRRSRAQLEKVEEAFQALKSRLERGEAAVDEQHAFHRAIAIASNNPHFRDFMQFLASRIRVALSVETERATGGRDAARKLLREFEGILTAVRLGDPDKARRAAWFHLLRSADRLGLRGLQGWEESRMTLIGENLIPVCAPADPQPRKPRFTPPPGACDCHAHIFGPESRYPYTRHRTYTPPDALLPAYKHMLATLGIQRAVIVQPSVYGTDNRATLDAIRAGGPDFRGVVVVDENIDTAEMERMHEAGVRGVRINLLFKSGIEVSDVRRLAEKIAPFGWHMQMLIDVSEFADIRETLGRLPVDVVFDHLGHMPTSIGTDHPGFQEMLSLLADGRAWAKISGAYRITSASRTPYDDVAPYARAIIAANPERVVWASDWPHPYVNIPMPNDGDLLDMLDDWAPDAATRDRILATNPARLYGFEESF
ncbi:GntR family transcriptional regulator [Tistrella mobilis]|uniref:GntR family transcriptional regulator n=1 Tax=Tistrella mobilis TaxID=171437 RepID=A0A161R2F1_9PROT|nr:amidohydrolase family protein [Tistrella mobilis]KYO51740.1 GntR family transcriptional regulator [Tistrella mobilis]